TQGGALVFTVSDAGPNNYTGLDSKNPWIGTGTFAHVELVDAGDQSIQSFEMYFTITKPGPTASSNYVGWDVNGGALCADSNLGGAYQVLRAGPLNPDLRIVRFREANGSLYWETSDGGAFVPFASAATPPWMNEVVVQLASGTYRL